jgi:hypothetical protein
LTIKINKVRLDPKVGAFCYLPRYEQSSVVVSKMEIPTLGIIVPISGITAVIITPSVVIFTVKSVFNQHLFVGKSADVAQLAEQVFCKHQVAGSRPCRLLQLF